MTSTQTVTITGYGSGGEGVARLDDGRAVFVRNAARGDVLEIRLTKEQPRSARAEIVRVLTPSPYRTEPDCPVYPDCGGCDFRHVTYEEELQAKLRRVNDALERIGGLSARAGEILSTGQTDGYRNKAVFHTAQKDGKTITGFYRPKSHEVVPVNRCLLLRDRPRGPEELDGLTFHIPPGSFFQVNTEAALLLYQKARKYAALSKKETLIDLYCGVGSLTAFVGRDAGRALGVEHDPAAIEAARENARRNGLAHIEFACADAAAWQSPVSGPDCVVADPPRKGLSSRAVSNILAMAPRRIVYVSCDPATFARDIRGLAGYTVNEACAVDMFPRTANVECCCLLLRD